MMSKLERFPRAEKLIQFKYFYKLGMIKSEWSVFGYVLLPSTAAQISQEFMLVIKRSSLLWYKLQTTFFKTPWTKV